MSAAPARPCEPEASPNTPTRASHQHAVADVLELRLDLDAVITSHLLLLLIALCLLLDAGDHTPRGAASTHLGGGGE